MTRANLPTRTQTIEDLVEVGSFNGMNFCLPCLVSLSVAGFDTAAT